MKNSLWNFIKYFFSFLFNYFFIFLKWRLCTFFINLILGYCGLKIAFGKHLSFWWFLVRPLWLCKYLHRLEIIAYCCYWLEFSTLLCYILYLLFFLTFKNISMMAVTYFMIRSFAYYLHNAICLMLSIHFSRLPKSVKFKPSVIYWKLLNIKSKRGLI